MSVEHVSVRLSEDTTIAANADPKDNVRVFLATLGDGKNSRQISLEHNGANYLEEILEASGANPDPKVSFQRGVYRFHNGFLYMECPAHGRLRIFGRDQLEYFTPEGMEKGRAEIARLIKIFGILGEYKTGTKSHDETTVDLDALAYTDKENMVWFFNTIRSRPGARGGELTTINKYHWFQYRISPIFRRYATLGQVERRIVQWRLTVSSENGSVFYPLTGNDINAKRHSDVLEMVAKAIDNEEMLITTHGSYQLSTVFVIRDSMWISQVAPGSNRMLRLFTDDGSVPFFVESYNNAIAFARTTALHLASISEEQTTPKEVE